MAPIGRVGKQTVVVADMCVVWSLAIATPAVVFIAQYMLL